MFRVMAAIIFVSLVIIFAVAIFQDTMSEQYYHSQWISSEGVEYKHGVALKIDSGWYVDIEPLKVVQIKAANSKHFRLTNGLDYLYGVPGDSPLGCSGDDYYRLEAETIEGAWEVKDGKGTETVLIGEEPFNLTYLPTSREFNRAVDTTIGLTIVACLIVIVIVILTDL